MKIENTLLCCLFIFGFFPDAYLVNSTELLNKTSKVPDVYTADANHEVESKETDRLSSSHDGNAVVEAVVLSPTPTSNMVKDVGDIAENRVETKVELTNAEIGDNEIGIRASENYSLVGGIGENKSLRSSDVDSILTTVDSPRGDTPPHESSNVYSKSSTNKISGNNSYMAFTHQEHPVIFNTMSWLDAFMFHHRSPLWILINTIFMVIWILLGAFSLYRLFGLPWCSPYLSKTQYLLVHLLIFTAATFEFVQLIHLSYGSYEGLPLFLTLLLTHTPTPCLAVSLIIMTYSVLVSAGIPLFGRYFAPPSVYVSIIASSIIVFSFVGDIVVGITRISIILILIRVTLNGICLIVFLAFVFNYYELSQLAQKMRRELRADLKSLPLPLEMDAVGQDSLDTKHHLKKILSVWSCITMVGCIFGILMCILSFSLSLFFTVSYVPLWAFWVIHSSIFTTQIILVICLTVGATWTLDYNSNRSIFYKYIFPSFSSGRTGQQAPFIKRGNCIYQRVSVANGPTLPQIMSTTVIDDVLDGPIRNNISPTPRSNVSLKRSATFSYPTPYGIHSHILQPTCSSNLYPVFSEHILPQSNSFKPNVNEFSHGRRYRNRYLQSSHSFNYGGGNRCDIGPYYKYRRRNPDAVKSFPEESIQLTQELLNAQAGEEILLPISDEQTPKHGLGCEAVSAAQEHVNRENTGCCKMDAFSPIISCDDLLYANLRSADASLPQDYSYCLPMNISTPMSEHREEFINNPVYNSNFPSFSNVSSRHYKQTPPKKPARFEPILVKSVIKENPCAENSFFASIHPDSETHSNGLENSSSNKADFVQVNSCGTMYSPDQSKVTPVNNESSTFSDRSYSLLSTTSPLISKDYGIGEVKSDVPSSNGSRKTSPKANLINLATTDEVDEELDSEMELKPVADPLTDLSSIKTDFTVESESGLPCPDYSSSFDSESGISGVSAPHKQALRRNHSTAGDCHSRNADGDADSSKGLNGSKYPWYGTWGGKKRTKKNSGHRNDSQAQNPIYDLKPLSSSKSSLSSLYGKVRSKRSKSMYYQQTPVDNPDECVNGKSLDDLSLSTTQTTEHQPDVEDEEILEFLPKIAEDIDLASEILESSTTLYNFYSLKRSDLKKRKEERLKNKEDCEDGQEVCEENGHSESLCNGVNETNSRSEYPEKNGYHSEDIVS